jgi:hypothetical protein
VKTAFLRLVGLPATDLKQIEVFLRFMGRSEDFHWISTAGDSCDLQLESVSAGTAISAKPLSASGQPASRGWILDRGQTAPDGASYVLRRPLQIDGFEALLRTRERELASNAVAGVARAAGRAAARRGAVPRAGTGSPAVDDDRSTYQLVRWPGSDLLRGKPKYVRMLGFLSNRPLSLTRLMVLSGIDEATCRDLLRVLDQRGLLRRGEAEPDNLSTLFADTVPSEGETAVVAAAPARARESANSGLFARLRKRLGLL